MPAPFRNPAVLFCPGEDGYLAYDPATDTVHRLNAAASLISELCDGERSAAEIARLIAPVLPEASLDKVEECIQTGLASGLFRVEDRPELLILPAALSKELRADGKIEAAYICQYNAAEQQPHHAECWSTLGELAHILGWREHAREAYERYLQLEPGNAEVRHLLIALRNEPPPPRAADEAIEQLYERFSSFYESNVVEELHYQAPKCIARLAAELSGGRSGLAALDLGCGTGLAGVELRPLCKRLVGVDLSSHMVEIARERSLYDRLDVAEITAWLARCHERFDLIAASDTLIYFGDLRQVLEPAAALLEPGGLIAFSLEKGADEPYKLSDSGRYTHHPEHVRAAAAAAGLEVARIDEGFLRMEYGDEVTGLYAALRGG
jgi:predicted TPR repeat methyltransferase